MSKGSKIVPVRFPDQMLLEMVKALDSRNLTTRDEQIELSEWIRRCVKDKLGHLRRSRQHPSCTSRGCSSSGSGEATENVSSA